MQAEICKAAVCVDLACMTYVPLYFGSIIVKQCVQLHIKL